MSKVTFYLLIAAILLITAAGLQFLVALMTIYIAVKGGAA